jgi:hypothetical protein
MMDKSPWSNPKRRPPTQAVITHSEVSLEEKISLRAVEVSSLHSPDQLSLTCTTVRPGQGGTVPEEILDIGIKRDTKVRDGGDVSTRRRDLLGGLGIG